MVPVFSTPILSIAADAVRDLEGRDTLSSLWTIFTKCKGSLQNGPRLENITWRLWHRELRLVDREKKNDLVKEDDASEECMAEKSAYLPPTPSATQSSTWLLPQHTDRHAVTPQGAAAPPMPHQTPSYSPSPLLSPSTVPRPLSSPSFIAGTPRSVGQIICDLLPVSTGSLSSLSSAELQLSDVRLINSSEMLSRPPADATIPKLDLSMHTTAITASTDMRPTNISLPRPFSTVPQNATSCLPTPEMEEGNLGHSVVHPSFPSQSPSPSSLVASVSTVPELSFSTLPDSSSKSCESSAPSGIHGVLNLVTPHSTSGQLAGPVQHSVDSSTIHHSVAVTLPPSHPPQSSSANVTVQSSPKDSLMVPRAATQPLVEPPRLVVVNPTPNPTPHPTPPTTPHISGGVRQQWLSPPVRGSSRVAAKSMTSEKLPSAPVKPVLNTLTLNPPPDQPRGAEGLLAETNSKIFSPDLISLAGQPFPQQASRSAIGDQYDSESARDSVDRHSVSSMTSSNYSHASTVTSNLSSTATASTTSASSNGCMDYEDKVEEFDLRSGFLHMRGNVPHSTRTRLGSPSTIKSMSTDQAWTEMAPDSGVKPEKVDAGDDKQFIEEVVNAGQHLALSSKPQPSNGAKHLKRNSAPAPLTSCATLNLSPTQAAVICCSPEASVQPPPPNTMGFDSCRNACEVAADNTGTTTRDRSTSQSRSGGSSIKGSQTPSRNQSVAADLSGLGTLGGYTITAAYPPPSMVVRKQVAVGAGKGKVKVGIRGLAKARPARRHSAGPGLDVGGKGKVGEVKALHSERQELPHIDQLVCQPPLPHGLTLITEEKPTQSAAVAQTEIPTTKLLPADEPISENHLKRPPRFNIGSNSDEGSGVGSKSAGSGSSVSGGHSQHVKKLTQDNGVLHGRTGFNAFVDLVVKQQERQQRPEVVQEMHHRQAVHSDGTSHASSPTRKSKKQDNRNGKKCSHQSASRQSPVSRTNMDDSRSPGWMSEKAKGKLKVLDHGPTVPTAPPAPKQASKSKSKSTPNLGVLDAVLAAKVRDSLADPLLPKGRPVVVATESEDETDTEDGWSSEELTDQAQEQFKRELAIQQERERQDAERLQHELLLRKIYMQQQHQPRPAGVQRTHSSHYPPANNARTGKAAQRPRQHQQREYALHHAKLEQAAREAQRQRDMIKKLPTESFQNLAKARANSVGLLTQLLNPNPDVLPPGHPYRRGFSSGAIQPLGSTPMVAIQSTTSEPGPSTAAPAIHAPSSTAVPDTNPPVLDAHHEKPYGSQPPPAPRRHGNSGKRLPSPSVASPPIRGIPMQLTKSSAALPVSSQVQVGSVAAKGLPSVAISTEVLANKTYRPKGPPKDQEMEEDSGSEPETGKIQVSKSVAEQKLKALAERRGIKQNQAATQPQAGPSKQTPRVDEEVPEWARVSQHQNWQAQRRSLHGLQFTPVSRPPPTAPIPLGHPYNLPPPDPPTTPRTTRRQMLGTELSESLRRNLLWERQVSKNNVAGMKRSSSTIVGRNGTQPFIGMPRVVQLHTKGTIPPDQQDDPSKRALGVLSDENEREEMRKHAMARNRSWANDFHYAGW